MAPVKLKYIVSFTSQDENHRATNLTSSNGLKKWLCHPKDRSGKMEMVVQLEEPTKFAFIDIGTIWCASLEVRVGLSDWPQAAEYKTLIPPVTLMSPIDGQLGRKVNNTQMFSQKDFSQSASNQQWDRMQIICRQPYKKDAQLGISFIRIRSPDQNTSIQQSAGVNHAMEKKIQPGEKMAEIQKHFFGDSKENERDDSLKHRLMMIASSSDSGCENPNQEALTRTAQLVIRASEKSHQSDAHYRVQQSKTPRREMFSNTKNRRNGLSIEEEISAFFPTLNLKSLDMENITIADLRHKFERIKKRKLSLSEKRKFAALCHDFVWNLMNEESEVQNISNLFENSSPANRPAVSTMPQTLSTPGARRANAGHISNVSSCGVTKAKSPCDSNKNTHNNNSRSLKASPAAVLRRKNDAVRLKTPAKSESSYSPTKVSNVLSGQSDSGSELFYDSSEDEREDNGTSVTGVSQNKTPQLKRLPRKTLEEVNRSYQELYSPSSSSCRLGGQNKESTTSPSAKRKKVNDNSKKLIEVFDSELSHSDGDKDTSSSSNSNGWLNTSKTGSTPKLYSKVSKKNSPFVDSFNPSHTIAPKSFPCRENEKNNSNSSSDKPHQNVRGRQGGSRYLSLKDQVVPTQPKSSGCLSSVSLLCKSCNFVIPRDTYEAHTAVCGVPPTHGKNFSRIHPLGKDRPASRGSTAVDLTAHNPGRDTIHLTDHDKYPQCPICLKQFPQEILITHASDCGL